LKFFSLNLKWTQQTRQPWQVRPTRRSRQIRPTWRHKRVEHAQWPRWIGRDRSVKPDNPHRLVGLTIKMCRSGWPDDINGSGGPDDPNGIDDLDELGELEDRDRPNWPNNQDGSADPAESSRRPDPFGSLSPFPNLSWT